MPYIIWLYANDREAMLTHFKPIADRLIAGLPLATSTFVSTNSALGSRILQSGGRVATWDEYDNIAEDLKNDDAAGRWLVKLTKDGVSHFSDKSWGKNWVMADMAKSDISKLREGKDYRVLSWYIPKPNMRRTRRKTSGQNKK